MRASVSENKQFIVHSLRKAANLKLLVEGKRWRPRWSSENCSDTTLGEANKFFLRRGGKRRIDERKWLNVKAYRDLMIIRYIIKRNTRKREIQ